MQMSTYVIKFYHKLALSHESKFPIAKLSPSQPANPELGAEIALVSKLS